MKEYINRHIDMKISLQLNQNSFSKSKQYKNLKD